MTSSNGRRDARTTISMLLLSSLFLIAGACATAPTPVAGPAYGGERQAAPASPADGVATGEEKAAASAERPGLGTEWGEQRSSAVRHTSFERAAASPTVVGAFYYNDRAGADAMASRDDFRRLAEAVFQLPNVPVSVSIRGESDQALPAVSTGSRCYAIGEAGARYTIEVKNESDLRLEVVASVDGLDVIDGRTASFSKRGYLIRPHGTLSIEGWRQSQETVAAFRFGTVRDSYAARTGSDRNVGVIGVAVFHERGAQLSWPWTDEELRRRQTADPFPNQYAVPPPPRVY